MTRLQELSASQQATLDAHNRQVEELQTQLKSRSEDLSTRGDNIKKLQEELSELRGKVSDSDVAFNQRLARMEQLEEELQAERAIVDQLKDEYDGRVASLEQQLKDREMEFKIAEKQNLRAIKDLQTRLKIGHSLGAAGSAHGTPVRSNSGSTLTASAPSTPTPSAPGTPRRISDDSISSGTPGSKSQHQLDIEAMGTRIGGLQDKNFKLEEKCNALLAEVSSLNDELEVKSRLIRKQSAMLKNRTVNSGPASSPVSHGSPVRANSLTPNGKAGTPGRGTPGRGTPTSEGSVSRASSVSFLPGVVTSLFGSSQPEPIAPPQEEEAAATMGNVLEETLLKSAHNTSLFRSPSS